MSPPHSSAANGQSGGHKQNGHTIDSVLPDENTPLLAVETAGPTLQPNADPTIAKLAEDEEEESDDDRPLPYFQVLVLCYCRLVDPIAFFSIFPFVSQMIYDTGSVSEGDVGFYTGLIESLFSLTQMCLMILWGKAADRFGRRPIMIISMIGTGIGMTAFGFSSNVWQMIACRCFAGVFSGAIVAIRAMFSEISTPKTAARAFSLFAVAGNVGIFIGPIMGGALSEPVKQYPSAFKNSEIFKRYPYGLATMVSGGFAFTAALVAIVFLKETLGAKEGKGSAKKTMSAMELLKAPGVAIVLFQYGWSSLTGLGYTAVAPVFWFTSPSLGGYGLSPLQISIYLAVSGLAQSIWTLFVFPPWQRKRGTGSVLYVLWHIYPVSMLFNPAGSILRRTGHELTFWIVSLGTQIANSSMAMTFMQLALNDIAPSHQTLGTLNALALTMASAIRAVAPAAFASFYAFGVSHKILGGYLIWILIFVLGLGFPIILRYVPERALRAPAQKKAEPEETSHVTEES